MRPIRLMNKQTRFNVGYAVAALFALALVQYVVSAAHQIAPLPYSEFRNLLHQGKIDSLAASDRFIQAG
jgi:cell division protease FtsH